MIKAWSKNAAGQVWVSNDPGVNAAALNDCLGICQDGDDLIETIKRGKTSLNETRQKAIHFGFKASAADYARAAFGLLAFGCENGEPEGLAVIDPNLLSGWTEDQKLSFCALLSNWKNAVLWFGEDENAGQNVTLDLSNVDPYLLPSELGSNDLSALGSKSIFAVFIGGAAGGTLEAIAATAEMLKNKPLARRIRLSVAPNSADVYVEACDRGYVTTILNAGGLVLNQCATPDFMARIGVNEVMVSNDRVQTNGYAGPESSVIILGSTEACLRTAVTGSLAEADAEETAAEASPAEKKLTGRIWKFGDDIDTDIIIPTQHVSSGNMKEMTKFIFEPLRPELAALIEDGDIIVAGNNFGAGSSREMAAEVIVAAGIRCIIAKSFARIFFRNAINNGILLIENDVVPDLVEEGKTINVVINDAIIYEGKRYPIGKVADNLFEIIMDGGLIQSVRKRLSKGSV